MCKLFKNSVLVVAATLLAFCRAEAQCDLTVNIPVSICAGDSAIVTFGFDDLHNVKVECHPVNLEVGGPIFLPDGHSCPGSGCYYQTTVHFGAFDEGAVMTSVEDIRFLRINIEHSYIADLYFSLECPDGTSVDIMKFGGNLNTECSPMVPEGARTWLTGGNVHGSADFGFPDLEDQSYCDSSMNPQGIGADYCWSNASGFGYPTMNDGVVYRSGNTTGSGANIHIQPSDVATGMHFYHPDESFANLIGCPLNGDWTFLAMDGFDIDNGYLFEWELAFDTSLCHTYGCEMDSFCVVGSGAYRIDDTMFVITMDTTLQTDSTVCYVFEAMDNCGNRFDTVVCVTFHPGHETYVFDTIVENMIPYEHCAYQFEETTVDHRFLLEDAYGCDSLEHYSLMVWPNCRLQFDTVVCSNMLPMEWRRYLFEEPTTATLNLNTIHGADSVVDLTLAVQRADTLHQHAYVCKGSPYTWIDGNTYYVQQEVPVYSEPTGEPCDQYYVLHLKNNPTPFELSPKANPNPATFEEIEVTLQDFSTSVARVWSYLGGMDTARISSFVYPYEEDSVVVTISGNDLYGCRDTARIVVRGDFATLWAPNAFTPDEQTNNGFRISTQQVVEGRVTIFTRGGLFVAEFDLLGGSWDGTSGGPPCPQGTYVWQTEYRTERNSEIWRTRIGTVTLLR